MADLNCNRDRLFASIPGGSHMSPDYPLRRGDVVQISPYAGSKYGGCLAYVSELKNFGAILAIQAFVDGIGDIFLYRAEWHEMEIVGRLVFIPWDEDADE